MKKVLSLGMAAVLAAVSLTACSSPSTTETTSAGDSAAQTESGEAGQEGAATGADGVFKIGGIGPVTGGAAEYGQAVKNGAEIAVNEINAAGGINGMQVEFRFEDDEHDAEKAVNAYNQLKDWDMQVLMGTVTSDPCVAVADKTNEDNMFQLTPSGSAVPCVQYDNAFRVCFSDPSQGEESAKYIADQELASKVAVIYDGSDVYSTGIYERFAKVAGENNLEIVSAEAFTRDNRTDFTVQLQKAQEAGAELVFLPIYYTEASLILTQANTMGFQPIFFGCDGMDGILAVENFDTTLAEGATLLTPFASNATDEVTANFVEAYQAAHNGVPNQFAADAYDAIYIIKAAAEEAGITADMSASDICEALKPAMTTIEFTGTTGKNITWTAAGEPEKAPIVVKIVDGAYELQN